MRSGSSVLNALKTLRQPHEDIVITKSGEWLHQGFVRRPEQLLDAIDVVFVALHGTYGEDGQVQRILERKRIPYVGTRPLSSAIAFNKELAKQTLRPTGIKMPRHRRVTRAEREHIAEEAPHILREVGKELFVKPLASGSSLGARYVPNVATLQTALTELLDEYEEVLVEEFVRGREATVGILDNFRNESRYALPVIEIVPPGGEPLFSHENKYNGRSAEICPGRFTYAEKATLAEVARTVHETIDCKHYSRSDFIVKDGEVYFLEVNTLPGLTEESLYPKAAAAVGLEFPQLVEHLIENAHA
jgi:D-alanine-D-alanine ligase